MATTTRAAAIALTFLLASCGGDDAGHDPGYYGIGAGASLDSASFPMEFVNNTRGIWADDQVFITIAGVDRGLDGRLVYLAPLRAGDMPQAEPGEDGLEVDDDASVGIVIPVNAFQNDDPETCVRKNDVCYPKLWFTLADLKDHTLYIPGDGQFYGSRIYVSYGEPLYMRINDTENGLIQLDVGNPNDHNFNTVNDFFEFTYDPHAVDPQGNPVPVPFGANVTQVDGFAIPMDFTVAGKQGTHLTRGITLGANSSSGVNSRDELIEKYLREVTEPFRNLIQRAPDGQALRLLAPYKSPDFQKGGRYFDYYDTYMQEIWAYYKTHTLVHFDQPNRIGNKFEGRVVMNDQGQDVLRFTRTDVNGERGPFDLPMANTFELFTQSGPFPNGADQAIKDMFRDLSSAVHRHVALDTDAWFDPARFYKGEPAHDYARFLHEVSIDGKAYAFGYDDAADQSSVIILPVGENPERVTVRLNW